MFGIGNSKKKSISDLPVEGGNNQATNDSLHNTPYAEALAKFIRCSDTPITIGIQGGWGSGKTSLMNMLEGKIADSSLVIKINAWEYSLFSRKEDVAVSLLSGLIVELRNAVDDAYHATPQRIDEETRRVALDLPTFGEKATQIGIGMVKTITGKAANVIIGNAIGDFTGNDLEAKNDIRFGDSGQARDDVKSIKELKKILRKVISRIMGDPNKNIHRVVFLIDDLDRVDPIVAVQILDVLKNVMELRDCVFILAIDFDVVVQGLKSKFGERSNLTEREHRQYFDKIIQVPFAMPVNSYRDKIKSLIDELMRGVNISCDELQADTLSGHAWRLTDGTPRSIKRVINTLSLLSLLSEMGGNEMSDERIGADELEILFIFVCLQINFPAVFNQIARKPNIFDWTTKDVHLQGIADAAYDNEEGADEWEHVLNEICSKDAWSNKRKQDIFKSLDEAYKGPITRIETSKISEILSKVSITSVNQESFVTAKDRIFDYYQLGKMTAAQVLRHKESSVMVDQLFSFTSIKSPQIKRRLSASPHLMVNEIFPEYSAYNNWDTLKQTKVSAVRDWNLYNLISTCLDKPQSEVKDKLQPLRGNTLLKTALKDLITLGS